MSKSDYLNAFNNHFEEFVEDITRVFPEDQQILSAVNGLKKLRKSNPKLIMNIFNSHIKIPYEGQIKEGNLKYFLEKDYVKDIEGDWDLSKKILSKIDDIKEPINNMAEEDQNKVVKYLQNLCKLIDLIN
tara:strand:+ start:4031 stop:4420 length:390 start_codon:yes stop_codon:yes gene_type:complete